MTTIGKVWTAGIAYVALAVGAGLSIMYNVVDTMTVRGPALDVFDVITAVAAPAIVLLMVEMFVSRIWIGQPWHIQVIRWLATLAIGGVAMRTSWTHGHDFMAGRGQAADVATLWPLAIDLLAIMATALILAGRTRGPVATDTMATDTMATDTMAMDTMAMDTMATEPGQPYSAMVDEDMAVATQPLSPEYAATLAAELDAWGKPEPELRTSAVKVPDEAVAMIRAWNPLLVPSRDVDAILAAHFGKTARTARRWRSIVTGAPTSGGG